MLTDIIYGIFNLLEMRSELKVMLVFSFFLFVASCSVKGQKESIDKNREMLKDYFLCCCIYHGIEDANIWEIDGSKSTYVDILNYTLPAMHKIDSLAMSFVNSMESSGYEGRETKGIIIQSIDYHKSKKLDRFVKSLDIYMLKDQPY